MSFFLLGFCPGQGWCVSSVSDRQPIIVPTFVSLFSLLVGLYTLVGENTRPLALYCESTVKVASMKTFVCLHFTVRAL